MTNFFISYKSSLQYYQYEEKFLCKHYKIIRI